MAYLLPEMLPSLRISKIEAGLIYGAFFMANTIFSPLEKTPCTVNSTNVVNKLL
jgi:hypothetical protein